jgi:hypothetical protein
MRIPMLRPILKTVSCVVFAGALSSCLAGIGVRPGVEVTIFPPAWFIATSSPEYYDGHATYWYEDRWYYRDGNSWRHYDSEPAPLRESRGNHEGQRKLYGAKHGGGYGHAGNPPGHGRKGGDDHEGDHDKRR